jgi:hypothetical protein
MVTERVYAYVDHWWPPGHVIGWGHSFIHRYHELLKSIVEDLPIEQAAAQKR